MISKEVMTDINVLCARVLNMIISNFNNTVIITKVPFIELPHSLEWFVSYKKLMWNKHPRQCIPLRQLTRQYYFSFSSSMRLVISQTNGTLWMYFSYQFASGVIQIRIAN
jgi:hypothetical protein